MQPDCAKPYLSDTGGVLLVTEKKDDEMYPREC